MTPSIYFVNPMGDVPSYYSAEVYGSSGLPPAMCIADLATPTVAAMVPDDFTIGLCDEHVTPVDFDTGADLVALTGKVSQWRRMRTLAAEFRARSKTVMIGGPYASLCPDVVREHCDILVRGEIEEIAAELFADLRENRAKDEYLGTRPDLDSSPIPRWDLYPNGRAEWGTVQTSRGCPFRCEFCDVIAYLGRNQRHKPIANVLKELDFLYSLGYRGVFLADDNLTVYRRRAKELLTALRDWNVRQTDGRVNFGTQVSVDAAMDDELLQLCSEAGLGCVYIGLETPNEESLKEARKRQNVGVDLVGRIGRFHDYGIMVLGGMIVGFDGDGPDIFERQFEFATAAALPVVTLGALVAPPATPLHRRMKEAGRLVEDGSEVAALPWSTNIIPARMSREELFAGAEALARRIYDPAAFGERVLHFIERQGTRRDAARLATQGAGPGRRLDADIASIIQGIGARGDAELNMLARVTEAVQKKPETGTFVFAILRVYAQIRHMLDSHQRDVA